MLGALESAPGTFSGLSSSGSWSGILSPCRALEEVGSGGHIDNVVTDGGQWWSHVDVGGNKWSQAVTTGNKW